MTRVDAYVHASLPVAMASVAARSRSGFVLAEGDGYNPSEMESAIATWVEEWGRLWGVPQLAARARVTTSRRLRRSLGRCNPQTRQVVCHELAHLAVHLLHGPRAKPHGSEWRALMVAAGYAPDVRFDPADLPEPVREAARPKRVWEHRCPRCDAARDALRRMRRWRCARCRDAGFPGRL